MFRIVVIEIHYNNTQFLNYTIHSTFQLASEKKQELYVADAVATSYLVFDDLIYPLDESLVLSGLGMNYNISETDISKAHVLHYNGNMKPWLQPVIYEYKEHWIKYLTKDSKFMAECNVK